MQYDKCSQVYFFAAITMMLGVFTVVITFQQDESSHQQRLEDRQAAREQRGQDQLAARQLRELERSLNDERYFNDIFDRYVRDVGVLLKENNGSLQSTEVTSTLARAKTLNVFRQLDPQRIISVIRFLSEARQLSDKNGSKSIDLSTAEFENIDFRSIANKKKMLDAISLAGILFYNVTFADLEMRHATFSSANFDRVDFSGAKFTHADFSSAVFDHADLGETSVRNATFSLAELSHANFSFAALQGVDLSTTVLHQVNFSSAILYNINFSSSKLANIDFSDALVKDVDFSSAELFNVNFTSAQLQNVNFASAKLHQVDFSSLTLSNYYQYNTSFNNGTLESVHFTFVRFHIVYFVSSELRGVNISHSVLASARFSRAKFHDVSFHQTSCLKADFSSAILSNVNFTDANMKGTLFTQADPTNVSFSNANLRRADLWVSQMTDTRFNDAFSVYAAQSDHRIETLDRNLVKNGEPHCNRPLTSDWEIEAGNILLRSQNENNIGCYFLLESHLAGAIMSQRVSLTSVKHSRFYPNSKAILKGTMGASVLIQLIALDERQQIIADTNMSMTVDTGHLNLYDHVEELEIIVHFFPMVDPNGKENGSWCRNLELYIDYGPDIIAPLRIEPMIPRNARWNRIGEILVDKWKHGNQSDQLNAPHGIFIADDQSIYIADLGNHRIIVKRDPGGEVETVAGGNGPGNGSHQLSEPSDVIFNSQSGSIFICDSGNRRIMQWSVYPVHEKEVATKGKLIIDDINCLGLTMDDQRSVYAGNIMKQKVRHYLLGDRVGIRVAGSDGGGSDLDKFNLPTYLFVDHENTLYVSDTDNRRVLKWMARAKQGIVVAGGNGKGNSLSQFSATTSVWVDKFHRVYVVDLGNNRIMRWQHDPDQGVAILDRISSDQGTHHISLFFDRHGHLYVTDQSNGLLKRFRININ